MLIGNYHFSLQVKGRLAIPAKFRNQLGEKPILTKGLDQQLNLLPFNIWSNLTSELGNSPLEPKPKRDLRRYLSHSASQVDFDTQGRILIPKPLINSAKLDKKVIVAGAINWVEIWDIDTYISFQAKLETSAPKLIETINQTQ